MRIHEVKHPLIAHKLTELRQVQTGASHFRQLTSELVQLLSFPATAHLRTSEVEIATPVETATGYKLAGPKPLIVPILRAGLGMLEGMSRALPEAEVGFLGMVRDHTTLEISTYAERLPQDLTGRDVFVLDPMLATGNTMAEAMKYLAAAGAHHVTAITLVSAPEGIAQLEGITGDLYTAAVDEGLTAESYIRPGLGDAGDRLFGVI